MSANETIIECPKCGTTIELNDALRKQSEDALRKEIAEEYRTKYKEAVAQSKEDNERKLRAAEDERRRALDEQELRFREREEQFRRDREDAAKRMAEREQELRTAIAAQAQEQFEARLRASEEERAALKQQRHDAQQELLEQMRLLRETEAARDRAMLDAEQRLAAERTKLREEFERSFGDEFKLRDAEKDKQIHDMQKLIDDLKRKSEQGSQQMQGEVLELHLEEELQREFKYDTITPVGKGVRGADIMQNVVENMQPCGMILWELKRTKSWSKEWIPKLKEDMNEVRADVAVIVSTALPDGVERFNFVNGVWVCDIASALPLAVALRQALASIAAQKRAAEGRSEKMDILYNYLTSNEFGGRVRGIVEAFEQMQSDLNSEKKAMHKLWSQREKQIERMMKNTMRLHGDLQGIMGGALPEMDILQLPATDEE
ncbi:MAG: DUF2130 domain-containing protein [Candidatus Kapabacteria bacterium]|nr:DUF2130 domain-containing protein [Candidatus Kapabacteria bacterium]